ncbi:MAG TPA: translation initiation factor IF-3 [Pirellulaceae bacterium]|nr:translation initiation factor IF-3 [Pirellulaceae bacterium]HMO93374.1 translation initiation factor IF-3 [Pirellulaceae bacterium]HMP70434.1 translation initiation factor IF-3 [Pirellulaceae bacterium]
MNEQIRSTPVRVIDADGTQLGIISVKQAIEKARDAGLDLVEVAPEAKPPVCRIMDYGKFKYEKTKKSAKQKTHQTKLKEIRLRPKTGQHDVEFKIKRAIDFLKNKDKVQVTVMFRGRENMHVDEGQKLLSSVLELLVPEYGKLESQPTQQPKRIMCTVAPK